VHAALDFEDQHYVFLTSGGKEIVDFYLEHINKYEGADVLLGHEATRSTMGGSTGSWCARPRVKS
jgi:hypothetical protein